MALLSPVLVLNQNFEPLNVCNPRRAFNLVAGGKAEVLEYSAIFVRTPSTEIAHPSVIRLRHQIRRPRLTPKLTRREIFARDSFTCQYCGLSTHDLTLDHVVPKHRGGPHSWTNLVASCKTCNHRKGGKSLAESRLKLLKQPKAPAPGGYYFLQHILRDAGPDHEWYKFVPMARAV